MPRLESTWVNGITYQLEGEVTLGDGSEYGQAVWLYTCTECGALITGFTQPDYLELHSKFHSEVTPDGTTQG